MAKKDHRIRGRSVAAAALAAGAATAALGVGPVAADSGAIFVPGNAEPWVATGITLVAGQQFSVSTDGASITWLGAGPYSVSGPAGQSTACLRKYTQTNCAINGAKYGALVAKVGSTTLVIGAGGQFTAPKSGELALAVNDNVGFYYDNSGGYAVRISVG